MLTTIIFLISLLLSVIGMVGMLMGLNMASTELNPLTTNKTITDKTATILVLCSISLLIACLFWSILFYLLH